MNTQTPKTIIALSALLVDVSDSDSLPSEIKLVPSGEFRSARDNRPVGLAAWSLDEAGALKIIANFNALRTDFLIDYDHQTLSAKANGQPAPAAGWGGELQWRDDGLYAIRINWTKAALKAIADKEYRYISPVIQFDEQTGAVYGVPMAALTNYPALDNLNDLAAAAADLFLTQPQETIMDKNEITERLFYLLNLPLTTTTEDLLAELDKLKTMISQPDGTTTGLSALLSVKPEIDFAKYVPIEVVHGLNARLAQLSSTALSGELDALIMKGQADGKILGAAAEKWARDMGKGNIAALKAYLESTPAIAALSGMQTEKLKTATTLPGDNLAACQALGVDASDPVAALSATEWLGNSVLSAEFGSFDAYKAYRKAESNGQIKILGAQ